MTTVLYFAYGSNMQSATFRGRRGIEPSRAFAARLEGWRIVFDKPPLIPIGESFANVVRDPGGEVFGVVYEIAPADLEHVDLSEGVLIGNYERVEVTVEPLGGGSLAAWVLTSERSAPSLLPSLRYRSLLVEGAREHGLPEAWVRFLEEVPAAEESGEARRLRPLMDAGIARRRDRNLP